MEWKDVAGAILNVAPALATALNAPARMIVGGAVQILTKFLGLPDTATPDCVAEAAAKLGPDQYVELKRIDAEYNKQLLDVGVKLEELAATDRKDARGMQVATRSHVPAILTTLLTAGFMTVLVGILWGGWKVEDSQVSLLLVGALITKWGSSVDFHLGTTASSARKTELLAKAPAVQ